MQKNVSVKPTKSRSKNKKLTHVYLQDKHLNKIPKISESVEVLYLYNNALTEIKNLNFLKNLTSLYLQNNQIKVVENLENLTALRRLFLGKNQIAVLENLNNLKCLEELYLEKQELNGSSLCFDPRTLHALSASLQVLNVSHNKIPSINFLQILINLRELNVSYNALEDLNEICDIMENFPCLKQCNFEGNPIAKIHNFREKIIAKTRCLEYFDGKNVSDFTRKFLTNLEREKKFRKTSKQTVNLDEVVEVAKSYPTALSKAVSVSFIKKTLKNNLLDDMSTFDERNAVFLAWKALPKRRPCTLKRRPDNSKMVDAVKSAVVVSSLPKVV